MQVLLGGGCADLCARAQPMDHPGHGGRSQPDTGGREQRQVGGAEGRGEEDRPAGLLGRRVRDHGDDRESERQRGWRQLAPAIDSFAPHQQPVATGINTARKMNTGLLSTVR